MQNVCEYPAHSKILQVVGANNAALLSNGRRKGYLSAQDTAIMKNKPMITFGFMKGALWLPSNALLAAMLV